MTRDELEAKLASVCNDLDDVTSSLKDNIAATKKIVDTLENIDLDDLEVGEGKS